MTEEKVKSIKGGITITGIGGNIEYSKIFHKIKLEKCHKCRKKDFAFVGTQDQTIYFTKCGQRYQVIDPETKQIWIPKP